MGNLWISFQIYLSHCYLTIRWHVHQIVTESTNKQNEDRNNDAVKTTYHSTSVTLSNHDHTTSSFLELVHVQIHPTTRCGSYRTSSKPLLYKNINKKSALKICHIISMSSVCFIFSHFSLTLCLTVMLL